MWKNFLSLIYPSTCLVCDDVLHIRESVLCLPCLYALPKTPFSHRIINEMSLQEYSNSVALFDFNNKNFQKLIHQFKYKGNYQIGEFFGVELGKAVRINIKMVDYIIPVPINRKKKRSRGYNQSYIIAKQVSKIINVPVLDVLKRRRRVSTQTNKNRYDRWESVKGEFKLRSTKSLKSKHVLIIDDVLTSGATIDSCIKAIKVNQSTRISIAVLAIA